MVNPSVCISSQCILFIELFGERGVTKCGNIFDLFSRGKRAYHLSRKSTHGLGIEFCRLGSVNEGWRDQTATCETGNGERREIFQLMFSNSCFQMCWRKIFHLHVQLEPSRVSNNRRVNLQAINPLLDVVFIFRARARERVEFLIPKNGSVLTGDRITLYIGNSFLQVAEYPSTEVHSNWNGPRISFFDVKKLYFD